MAIQKIDVLRLGRGNIFNNNESAALFASNNLIATWSNSVTYNQFNTVEYNGKVYRSKIPANLNNQPDISPNEWETILPDLQDGAICVVISGSNSRVVQRVGGSWVSIGGAGGLIKVAAYDPVATSLTTPPANTDPYVVDGYTIQNGDLVLFSNLTSNNNQVYKANISGGIITWSSQTVFNNNAAPAVGDTVIVQNGTNFKLQIGKFNGTQWTFGDVTRYFVNLNFYEQTGLHVTNLPNNSSGNIFTVNYTGSENWVIHYSIQRSSIKESGTITMTTNGTDVALSVYGANTGSTGVTFDADISGSQIRLKYTTDNSGSNAIIKYFIFRWSDYPGGPSGVPNYTINPSPAAAGGSNQDIQYNSNGILSGNANHRLNATDGYVTFGDVQYKFSQSFTINDNQSTPTPLITWPFSVAAHAIVEYSVVRNNDYRTGRLLVASDGTNAFITNDFVETNPVGVNFSADVNSGNVRILYTSTATGFNGIFKAAYRRW